MNTFQQLIALQSEVYEGNKARGFWEKGQDESSGERVMLIISELSEAVEAHRKDNLYNRETRHKINRRLEDGSHWAFDVVDTKAEAWHNWFSQEVKDTVQDEIADTVIRILDYTGGFGIELESERYSTAQSTGNFAEDVLRLVDLCVLMCSKHNAACTWDHVLSRILKFCEWYSIDILQHVHWKLKYNATRPYKHGKAY